MSTLQREISETFLKGLEEHPDISPEMIDHLRELFLSEKKIKPDELVKVFAPPTGGEVK